MGCCDSKDEEQWPLMSEEQKRQVVARSKFPREEIDSMWEEYASGKQLKSKEDLIQIFDRFHLLDELWTSLASADGKQSQESAIPRVGDASRLVREFVQDPRNAWIRDLIGEQLFQAFDADGDGRITFDELIAGISTLLKGSRDEHADLFFRQLDRNRSGDIDRNELFAIAKRMMVGYRSGFLIGLISQQKVMERTGQTMDDWKKVCDAVERFSNDQAVQETIVNAILESVDTNKDGKISSEEFRSWYLSESAQSAHHAKLNRAIQHYVDDHNLELKSEIAKIVNAVSERNKRTGKVASLY